MGGGGCVGRAGGGVRWAGWAKWGIAERPRREVHGQGLRAEHMLVGATSSRHAPWMQMPFCPQPQVGKPVRL